MKDLKKLHESCKGKLHDMEMELGHMIRSDDPNVIMLCSRRCLELIIADLSQSELHRPSNNEPFKRTVDKLGSEEKIPPHIISSIQVLNELSIYGVQPKDTDLEQLKPVLENLGIIIKWYQDYRNITADITDGKKQESEEGFAKTGVLDAQNSGVILNYNGPINSDTIESILIRLKQSNEYKTIDKIARERVYAIVVECVENIFKYSLKKKENGVIPEPYIMVMRQHKEVLVITGNATSEKNKLRLVNRINQINNLDEAALKLLYNKEINRELNLDEIGAGLGLIIIALKSRNKIQYSFPKSNSHYSFVEFKIPVNIYFIEKLIIERTAYSPQIHFDPGENIYQISGESRPHDIQSFYGVILKWLDEFSSYLGKSNPGAEPVIFDFNLDYFNSLSAKYILDFCKRLATIRSTGKDISIKWHFEADDLDMLEAGRELANISRIPFEFIIDNDQ